MKKFVLLLAAVALASAHRITKRSVNCTCGRSNSLGEFRRIVGGVETEINEFPFMAALMQYGSQFCGGTIISEYHVLTAAHCTENMRADQIVVSVGDHDWASDDETSATVQIKVAQIIDHENYQPKNGYWNDISLLVLEKPIKMNTYVGPVCLPPKNYDTDNKEVTVIGWGGTSFDDNADEGITTLQKITLSTFPFASCRRRYRLDPANTQLCLVHDKNGMYRGDSGGTIVYQDNGSYVLVGVPSYVNGVDPANRPSVATRVSSFVDWIEKKVKATKPSVNTCSPFSS